MIFYKHRYLQILLKLEGLIQSNIKNSVIIYYHIIPNS